MFLLQLIPRAQQERFREMLHSYFGKLKDHLHKEHKALRRRNKENKRILEMKGELTEERIAENEQAQKAFEKLMTNMGTLSVSVCVCVCARACVCVCVCVCTRTHVHVIHCYN